ncbi:hypothetical protein, partial [Streptomyces sp. NPDC002067]
VLAAALCGGLLARRLGQPPVQLRQLPGGAAPQVPAVSTALAGPPAAVRSAGPEPAARQAVPLRAAPDGPGDAPRRPPVPLPAASGGRPPAVPAVQRKAAPVTPRPAPVVAPVPPVVPSAAGPAPVVRAPAQPRTGAAPAAPPVPAPFPATVQRAPEQDGSSQRARLEKGGSDAHDAAKALAVTAKSAPAEPEREQGREQQPLRTSARNRHLPKEKSAKRSAKQEGGGFDARNLTDGQVDELVHRLVGLLIPRLKAEFRHDRERIGRLRDPRR